MTESYLAVAGRIRRELGEVKSVVERARRIWTVAGRNEEAVECRVDAVALNLHGFYAGLERIFETIARRVDRTVPEGGSWHQELLDQMNTELSGVRPPVLSDESRKQLERYRGFRHVVRNVYTFEFESEQIDLLVSRLPQTIDVVEEDLLAFAEFLDEVAQSTDN